jgi:hypothetical protein
VTKEVNSLKKRRKKRKGLRNTDVQDMFETCTNAADKNDMFNGKKDLEEVETEEKDN